MLFLCISCCGSYFLVQFLPMLTVYTSQQLVFNIGLFEYTQCRGREEGSLVPRPLLDFISQPWRRRPGIKTMSRTGNGGLGLYVMWTQFHNDGMWPASNQAKQQKFAQMFASGRCVGISRRRFACTLTIRDCESKRLRASASLRVETSGSIIMDRWFQVCKLSKLFQPWLWASLLITRQPLD